MPRAKPTDHHHLATRVSPPTGIRWLLLFAALLTLLSLQLWLLISKTGIAFSAQMPRPAWLAAQGIAFASILTMLWRVLLVARYRSTPSVHDDRLPFVTVVVPAYNEGRQVFETVASLIRSDYPQHKLHIVCVDDGSVDDTWQWMSRAARVFSSVATAIRCRHNRGKRHALYEGFSRARGTVVVTVDSDSEVLPDTLRNLVSPFIVDARIGAVAGNVRVLNQHQGFVPRMLDVSFNYAFEFMRASESEVGAVQCCPGALSAYRLDFIREVQDEWLVQSFFGRPANIGEDRALTNLALKHGFRVTLQANAIVLTEVPTAIPQLSRMFLRWARSNVRETLVLARFVFRRFRHGPKTGARINFTWSALRLLLGPVGFVAALLAVAVRPDLVLLLVIAGLLSAAWPATIYAISRDVRGALWAFPYAVMSATVLSWIAPYALVSAHRSGWLTRELPAATIPAPPQLASASGTTDSFPRLAREAS